jgi:hypothetical protein
VTFRARWPRRARSYLGAKLSVYARLTMPGRLTGLSVLALGGVLAVTASPLASSTRSVPVCRAQQLRLAASFYGEAAGQFVQTFTFMNVGHSVCQLRGWPSLELTSKSGRPVSVRSRRVVQGAPSARPFRTVVLRRRGAASFDVYGADWNFRANRPCSHTTAIFVTPPGDRSMLLVAVKMPNCGLFDVAPVIAGKTDRHAWSRVWHR